MGIVPYDGYGSMQIWGGGGYGLVATRTEPERSMDGKGFLNVTNASIAWGKKWGGQDYQVLVTLCSPSRKIE